MATPPRPLLDPPGVLVRELRLAVVCYGGVSLAVYMHGVVKEIDKLVRASHRLAVGGAGRNPFANEPGADTEAVYWDLLVAVSEALSPPGEPVRLRVVVDVIAGASAGGINGILLAKALTQGASQDHLRATWLDKANIWHLMLRGGGILGGDRFTRDLIEALDVMDRQRDRRGGRQLPPDHPLDLFVTVTDLGGRQASLPIADPPTVVDLDHRHVLRFRSRAENGRDELSAAFSPLLAFAARGTASFPGVMAPVSIADVATAYAEDVRPWPDEVRAEQVAALFAPYLEEPGQDPEGHHFIDGGVLNNKPFDLALSAIGQKPAAGEVDRRLVYIEPEPLSGKRGPAQGARPGSIATALRATLIIPLHQPIIDTIEEIDRHNRTVDLIAGVVRRHRPAVMEWVEQEIVGGSIDVEALSPIRLEGWRRIAQERVHAVIGPQHPIYVEIKLRQVVRWFAEAIADRLGHHRRGRRARFIADVLSAWAERAGLIGPPDHGQVAPDRIKFLKDLDIPFRLRRLRFLIAEVNSLYARTEGQPAVPRRALDRLKQPLYALVTEYAALAREQRHTLIGGAVDEPLDRALSSLFGQEAIDRTPDPATFLKDHMSDIDDLRERFGRRMIQRRIELRQRQDALMAALGEIGLDAAARRGLMLRYLGFPLWDALILPLQEAAGVESLSRIDVMRVSSIDANRGLSAGPGAKLMGGRLGQFGGFFRRSWRENDYLWGRLDGADRMIQLIRGLADPDGVLGRVPFERFRHRLLRRILETERGELARVRRTIETLERELDLAD